MIVYKCLVDGKQIGNLISNFYRAKKYLVNYMWGSPNIPRVETSVWASEIYSKFFPFDIELGCGIKVGVHEVQIDN